MEWLFIPLGLIILLVTAVVRNSINNDKLQRKIRHLSHRVEELEDQVYFLRRAPSAGDRDTPYEKTSDRKTPVQEIPVQSPAGGFVREVSVPESPVAKTPGPSFLERFEKKVMENWTGILGSMAIVAGFVFLGIFTALKLNEFYRFLMLDLVALLFLGLFFFFRNRPGWRQPGLWFRSISGALFLFACLASGRIEGLIWLSGNPANLLLGVGIGANLLLAFLSREELVASIHEILCLIALALAPSTETAFLIATVISLWGLFLTVKKRWDYQLLMILWGYFLYTLFYYFTARGEHLVPTGGVLVVGLSALLIHYRELYKVKGYIHRHFFTHLFNWFFLGTGLFLFAPRGVFTSLPLGAGALGLFFLARGAGKRGLRWLYVTDMLAAQFLAFIAFVALVFLEVSVLNITVLCYFEVLIFCTVMGLEKESFLFRGGLLFSHMITIVFLLFYTRGSGGVEKMGLPGGLCLGAGVFHFFFTGKYRRELLLKLQGIGSALFLWLFYLGFQDHFPLFPLPELVLLLPLGALIVLRHRTQSSGALWGLVPVLLVSNGAVLVELQGKDLSFLMASLRVLLFLILGLGGFFFSYSADRKRFFRWPGIYLVVINLIFLGYKLFQDLFFFLPGLFFLLLSLFLLEGAGKSYKKKAPVYETDGYTAGHFLNAGYLLLALFVISFIVNCVTGWVSAPGPFPRFVVYAAGIFVFLYWGFLRPPKVDKARLPGVAQPYFLELLLAWGIYILFSEFSSLYFPLLAIGSGIGVLLLGRLKGRERLGIYALLFYWSSLFFTVFAVYLNDNSLEANRITGLISFGFIFIFLVLYHNFSFSGSFSLPRGLGGLSLFASLINRRKNLWSFYPMIAGMVFFFSWAFDSSLFTLLLGLEAFALFVVSIVLREPHFRYLSLGGMLICLIRLIFVDMARSDTLTRAVVFIVMGGLMLFMNLLYNKFGNRYKK